VANKKKTPETPTPPPASRVQRVLWYMVASILGIGIIAIAALLIGEATTPVAISDASGIWAVVALVPNIALPVGFVLMIVLLVITFVKRSRAAEGAGK
jgi:TRAP-type C4-dicarboxylate transport system permease small subunit